MATTTEARKPAGKRSKGAKRKAKPVAIPGVPTLDRACIPRLANVIARWGDKQEELLEVGMRLGEATAYVAAFNRVCADTGKTARLVECDPAIVRLLAGVAPASDVDAEALPPLRFGVYRNGALTRVDEVADPRKQIAATFNEVAEVGLELRALTSVRCDFSIVWFKSPDDWRPLDPMPDGWKPDGVLVEGLPQAVADALANAGNFYLDGLGCKGRWAVVVREGGAA